ncbi:uncharacterized protein LOC115633046 [Scaptodrosophila lebanonensis]|uniref:Uncharacterized protein LOC115633046 n=1 Tax=Drosophila lebanonensis TaxID=7225 RepID=A0A6J2UDM3_DROLE|nr:uncharacterized protein LOC115633046 [Scaptodrosophila lebanonensis]
MSCRNLLLGICLVSLTLLTAHADVSHLRNGLEYSITPSSQVAYYHYPTPQRAQPRLGSPPQRPQQQRRYQAAPPHHQSVVRQFTEPALDHVAFTQALTSQGYVFGAASAPLAANTPPSVGSSPSGRALGSSAAVDANSLNVKLPVPFGITPLNVAQLPLQAGAPYSTVSHTTGLTSYGTPEIQRR